MDYFKKDDGGLKVDNDFKKKRMKVNYPHLFPLFIPFKDKKQTLRDIRDNLKDVNFNNNVGIFCKHDLMKACMLYGFITLGEYVDYNFMNGYRLLNISLGKDNDYNDVTYINNDYLIIYLGYKEFNNKRQSDVVEQVIEDRMIKNKKTWIYYMGSQSKFKRKYKGTLEVMKRRRFEIVDINLSDDLEKEDYSQSGGSSSMDIEIDEI
jgi:hypothetical protein